MVTLDRLQQLGIVSYDQTEWIPEVRQVENSLRSHPINQVPPMFNPVLIGVRLINVRTPSVVRVFVGGEVDTLLPLLREVS